MIEGTVQNHHKQTQILLIQQSMNCFQGKSKLETSKISHENAWSPLEMLATKPIHILNISQLISNVVVQVKIYKKATHQVDMWENLPSI